MKNEKIVISSNEISLQIMEQIKEQLSSNNSTTIEISNSYWKLHSIGNEYTENTLSICTDFASNQNFDILKQKAVQYYLENEKSFYNLFIKKIKRMLVFEDFYSYDFEPACEANEIELPETITDAWLQENIKLIAINILDEKEDACFLEFDFAVSWDDEHGMRALVYKDTFLAFDEGGCIWSDDIASYDDEYIEKIDTNI